VSILSIKLNRQNSCPNCN